MSKLIELECLRKKSIMEEFSQYLMNCYKMSPAKVKFCINMVRKFHNYVGKPYAYIKQDDIRNYLFALREHERLKDSSIDIHLVAIKKFYQYLLSRGEVSEIPLEGLKISDLKREFQQKMDNVFMPIKGWVKALQDAQEDPNACMVVVTAVGAVFCTGEDAKSILLLLEKMHNNNYDLPPNY